MMSLSLMAGRTVGLRLQVLSADKQLQTFRKTNSRPFLEWPFYTGFTVDLNAINRIVELIVLSFKRVLC